MKRKTLFVMLAAAVLLVQSASASYADAKPLKIIVYGGTGMIGQRIVSEALRRGDAVTIVVRNPPANSDPKLTVLRGDILDPADIVKKIAGQDVVIEAVSATTPQTGTVTAGSPSPNFYIRVTENLVNAARQLGPKAPRLLLVGGASSLYDTDGVLMLDKLTGFPKTSAPYLMKESLDYLRPIQDVSWTMLSPAGKIAPGQRTGKFRLGDDTVVKDASGVSSISAEDFAIAMLDEAHTPAHVKKRFTLGYQ